VSSLVHAPPAGVSASDAHPAPNRTPPIQNSLAMRLVMLVV
jgi:hypothetical protein